MSYLPDKIRDIAITPMAHLACPYYFRITTQDRPGVLSAISGILGKHGISIESVVQKKRREQGAVPIIMLTYEAQEENVNMALAEIDALDTTADETLKIRILVEKQSD